MLIVDSTVAQEDYSYTSNGSEFEINYESNFETSASVTVGAVITKSASVFFGTFVVTASPSAVLVKREGETTTLYATLSYNNAESSGASVSTGTTDSSDVTSATGSADGTKTIF
ncbi:unnamed protein product [[Candida] boidinii]|nr:unnamed protein product [[Candida] boidinii]